MPNHDPPPPPANPRTQVLPSHHPNIDIVNAPAPTRAGGRPENLTRDNNKSQHLDAAALVTSLVIINKMYKTLMERGVGTGAVESEATQIEMEREAGPTGHSLLVDAEDQEDEDIEMCEDPEASNKNDKASRPRCWRDPALIKKLMKIRKKTVTAKLKEARSVLIGEMKYLAKTLTKSEVGKAWEDVRRVRREIWEEEEPKRQRKIDHLTRKSEDCSVHTPQAVLVPRNEFQISKTENGRT